METHFKSQKLQKLCEDYAKLKYQFGDLKAKRILMRIGDLEDAANLYDVSKLPQARLHPLKGDREGEYAVVTLHPYRLIFIALEGNPADYKSIQKVEIISINEDYH